MDDAKVLVYEALKQRDMTIPQLIDYLFPGTFGYERLNRRNFVKKGILRLKKWDWIEVTGHIYNPNGRDFCIYGIKGEVRSFSNSKEDVESKDE